MDQKDRAPLIRICEGNFRVESCKFYDSSKDGIEVCPKNGADDIVGGTIRNIEAFRMGRDAVSLSGGNQGLKVRNVIVENISLRKGYLKGAVEVSDGTDNITVRNVYAEDCAYAIDVQDHGGESAANTNIHVEKVEALNCGHIIITANSPRGHAKLTLRDFKGTRCEVPIQISNTSDVTIEGLKIIKHQREKKPPISLKNCQHVTISHATVETIHFVNQPIHTKHCENVIIAELTVNELAVTD